VRKLWYDRAWDDYEWWQSQDKKTLKRINALFKDIERNGYHGIGKPEPLLGRWFGKWSVRIDAKNRLIFKLEKDHLAIFSCKGHYDE
jgi:toxin YoeB